MIELLIGLFTWLFIGQHIHVKSFVHVDKTKNKTGVYVCVWMCVFALARVCLSVCMSKHGGCVFACIYVCVRVRVFAFAGVCVFERFCVCHMYVHIYIL